MAILDTLWILIKSDASNVKQGAEQAEKSTKKLNDSLKQTEGLTDHIGQNLAGVVREFSGYIAGIVSAGAILHGLKGAIDYSIELANTARLLGVNVELLDEWGNAVQRTGGTAQGFQSSLRSLAEHLGTTPKIALHLLPQLADAFHRLSRFQALQYGKMLGLDESTILLLQEGRREVEAIIAKQKELGVVTERDAKISLEFNNAIADSGHAFRSLYNELAVSVLPILTKFLAGFTKVVEYMTRHKELIVGTFVAIGGAAAVLAAPFIAANAAVIALTASLALLVSAFAIIFEDIARFKEGKSSLYGDLLKKNGTTYVSPEEGAEQFRQDLEAFKKLTFGQKLMAVVTGSPVNTQTPNTTFATEAFNRNASINVGDITIHTQATDGPGIADTFKKHLTDKFWHANNFFADGVAY